MYTEDILYTNILIVLISRSISFPPALCAQHPRLPPLQNLLSLLLALTQLRPRPRSIRLAIAASLHLKMTVRQSPPTRLAHKTVHVMLPLRVRLHIRTLDAQPTSMAQRVIQIVVVIRAVGPVMHDVTDFIKRCAARVARKTLFMIPTRQAIISSFDGATTDFAAASST